MSVSIDAADVEALAHAAAKGEERAFEQLYETYYDPLLRYVALRTENNLTVAEDIAASTWEKVARSIHAFESRGAGFPAWLFTIARRSVQEHYRTLIRRPERLDGEMLSWDRVDVAEGPDVLLERKVRDQQVAAAVRSLSAAQRRCVTLRFFVNLSLADTAEVMGKNANTIKQLQHRALGTLRKRLGEQPVDGYHADTHVDASEYDATTQNALRQSSRK